MELPGKDDAPRPPGRLRFAGCVLDRAAGRLLVGEASHALDQGSLGVLEALLAAPGAMLAKDRLLGAGWPGRVVSENSLNKAVSRLRQLIGDPNGEVLRTVHGYGYRLAARVEQEPDAPVTTPAPAGPTADSASQQAAPPGAAPHWLAPALAITLAALVPATTWLVWRATAPGLNAATTTQVRVPERASIAVLPFDDLSPREDQRYFSDGLADELLDRLSKLPQLRVASRTSSFAYRGREFGVEQIGRELGVATVLEGSVRRDGERLRITVQLISVDDGFHLWSASYDREATDALAVQADLAAAMAEALGRQLLPAPSFLVTEYGTRNAEALREFRRGERLHYAGSPDADRLAIAAYERAIALDPSFSTPYAALADLLGGDARYADSPEQVRAGKQRAISLLDKAIALEPDRPDYFLARADYLYYTRRDWAAAQRDLDVAARMLHGRTPQVLMRQVRLQALLGQVDEAIAGCQLATQAEPKSDWAWGYLGYLLASEGRFDEAHAAIATAQRLLPDDTHVAYYDGLAYLLEGKPAEARAAFERSGSVLRLVGLVAAAHSAGDEAGSRAALKMLVERHAPMGAYQVAQAHAWRGEKDEAFAWLDRAERQEDGGLTILGFDPLMRSLHGDARYRQWLHRLRLDEPPARHAP